jgi:uncharacterized protein YuzE
MRLSYFAETDSLYIDLRGRDSVDSIEVAEGVVLDFGEDGVLVGIDIDNASRHVDLDHLILTHLDARIERIAS